jgi:DNA-binding MarR family transcriptional regulator
LTNDRRRHIVRRMNDWVASIQRFYPRIYLACHVDHVRATSNRERLSSRDSSVLSHLERATGERPARLARHLRVRPSSLTPILARLEKLGLVERQRDAGDRRRHLLFLTADGERVLSRTSVLDPQRLRELGRRMSADERRRAAEGLQILADAARRPARSIPPRQKPKPGSKR